jgi:hypothetical protein
MKTANDVDRLRVARSRIPRSRANHCASFNMEPDSKLLSPLAIIGSRTVVVCVGIVVRAGEFEPSFQGFVCVVQLVRAHTLFERRTTTVRMKLHIAGSAWLC